LEQGDGEMGGIENIPTPHSYLLIPNSGSNPNTSKHKTKSPLIEIQNTKSKIQMSESVDLSKLIAETDLEMKRLGWTSQKGREFVSETYGKRERNLLTLDELLDFLRYLQYLPTPETKLDNPSGVKLNPPSQSSSNQNKTVRAATKKTTTKKTQSIDLSEVIVKTDVEMERLGWTPQQGREYLIQTYNKRGRTLLTEEELLDFLQHLESSPTPQQELSEADPLAGF